MPAYACTLTHTHAHTHTHTHAHACTHAGVVPSATGALLKQAVERIARMRDVAVRRLRGLVDSPHVVRAMPAAAQVATALPEGDGAAEVVSLQVRGVAVRRARGGHIVLVFAWMMLQVLGWGARGVRGRLIVLLLALIICCGCVGWGTRGQAQPYVAFLWVAFCFDDDAGGAACPLLAAVTTISMLATHAGRASLVSHDNSTSVFLGHAATSFLIVKTT